METYGEMEEGTSFKFCVRKRKKRDSARNLCTTPKHRLWSSHEAPNGTSSCAPIATPQFQYAESPQPVAAEVSRCFAVKTKKKSEKKTVSPFNGYCYQTGDIL